MLVFVWLFGGVDMCALQNGPCDCDNEEGVQKLKQGDEATWEQLIKCYSSRLQRDIMLSLLKRSMLDWSLQDIEQETWMIADKRINMFTWHGQDSLYHWLRVISLYRILSRLPRKKFMEESVSFQELDGLDGSYDFDKFLRVNMLVQDSPESEMILREQRAELLNILLSDEAPLHIEIAIKRWVEGKKPQELAASYAMNARDISKILWSLRKRLTSLERFLTTDSIGDSSFDQDTL